VGRVILFFTSGMLSENAIPMKFPVFLLRNLGVSDEQPRIELAENSIPLAGDDLSRSDRVQFLKP
jgi:hypothetical protein